MRYKLRYYRCDKCNKKALELEQESVVVMGWVYIVLGLCTSMFIVGVPILIVGIIKVQRGYRYKTICTNCGLTHYSNRYVTENMLEEGDLVEVGLEEKPVMKYRVKRDN